MLPRCLAALALPALCLALPGGAQPPKGKKYAVLVGVTEYDHASLPALKYTEYDAEELAEVLQKRAGFTSVRVLSLSRGKMDRKDSPTKANIEKALADLFGKAKRDDTVLVALAGHGVQLEVKDPKEEGPARTYSYFCPSDAHFREISYRTGRSPRMVLMPALLKELASCGAGTKLILVDACRNELKADSSTRSFDTGELSLAKGMAALFSCKPGERAWETGKLGKRGHGVFFHYVIEGLKGEAANKKGEVTWAGLTEYVNTSVAEKVPELFKEGASQTPHGAQNFFGGSPVLVKADKGPGKEVVAKGGEPRPGAYDAHDGGVRCLAVSPNGKVLASGGQDGLIKLWALPSMKLVRTLKGHKGNVFRIAFNPAGTQLATVGSDKSVRLWDPESDEVVRVITGHTEATGGVTFSRDGRHLVSTGGDKTVRLWEAGTGKSLGTLGTHDAYVYVVEVSPDGKYYASCSTDKTIKLFSATDRREALTLRGHDKAVTRLAYAPDNRRLASASLDKTLRLWDCQTGKELARFTPEEGEPSSLCFSRDGRTIAMSHLPGLVSIWNPQTEKTVFSKRLPTLPFCVVFSPGQKSLIVGLNATKDQPAKISVVPIE